MRSFRLLTLCLFTLLLAACQGGNILTSSTPTTAVLPTVASVTPVPTSAATAAPLPTPTLTPLPLYPFDPGPTPEFDPTTNQWIVTDQQDQKWMLDAAINIWGKPGEAIVLDGQLLVWDQQLLAYIDSRVSAASGERVEVSNGQSVWAAYTVVSGQQTLTAVVLSSGEVVGAEGGLVWTGKVNPDGTLSSVTPATLMYWDSAEQRLVQAEVDSSVIDEVNNFINDGANRQISIKKNDRQGARFFTTTLPPIWKATNTSEKLKSGLGIQPKTAGCKFLIWKPQRDWGKLQTLFEPRMVLENKI